MGLLRRGNVFDTSKISSFDFSVEAKKREIDICLSLIFELTLISDYF